MDARLFSSVLVGPRGASLPSASPTPSFHQTDGRTEVRVSGCVLSVCESPHFLESQDAGSLGWIGQMKDHSVVLIRLARRQKSHAWG